MIAGIWFEVGDKVYFDKNPNHLFIIEEIRESDEWIWSSGLEDPYILDTNIKNFHNPKPSKEFNKRGKLKPISELRDNKLNELGIK